MDFADFTSQTGKTVFNQNGVYITGTSYNADKELQLKQQQYIHNKKFNKEADSYIYSGQMEQTEFKSDNYNDILKITGMPANCLRGVYGDKSVYGEIILEKIEEAITSYCDGNITDEELKKIFCDFCKDTRMYHIQSRHTSGINKADNQCIIRRVYEYSQKANVREMVFRCFEKGKEIAKNYGGEDRFKWVYYDADYYYKSQHIEELLKEAASGIAKEWNIDVIDFDYIAKNSHFGDGGLDFNSTWNFVAVNRSISAIKDFNCRPEPGFSLFYQSNKCKNPVPYTLESQSGICIVKSGGNIWITDVPFNNSLCLGELADCFNVGSLFGKNILFKDESLLQFLNNFEIFTYVYGHNNYWG